ncbi:hypothetical protein SLS53_002569 [Cytospora paraplurivora]|uniref:Uncharacterized protein n=1 Tax=Cytospora paraplurivora TaxID=2898453 RepID=A0AAN9YIY2_9PEZI
MGTMAYFGGGNNPAHGRDSGPPPPNNRPGYGIYGGYGYGLPPPYGFSHPAPFYPQQPFNYGGYGNPHAPPVNPHFTNFAAVNRPPTIPPIINPDLPAANMTNSTGGVGCEPGYNYFYPAEHTKILVFRTGNTPPWHLEANRPAPFHAAHVPVNTTMADLLKGFGATNPDPRKNKVIEVHQGGGGKWYKGMSFDGDDEKAMAKTLKEVGWDSSRNGLPGGKPVVYLYVTKG